MSNRILKISLGLLSLTLLIILVFKLRNVPGGMILSGLILGGIIIVGILLGCLVVASILKLLLKKTSYFTLYLISTIVAFLYFHYSLYSPTLKIIVPNGYKGEVNLVLSNVKDNVLHLDTNGTGYITQWTFDHNYVAPLVIDEEGKNLNDLCVGFNSSTFWGATTSCCVSGKQIKSMSFVISPKDKTEQTQYNSKDWTIFVNKKIVKFAEPDGYTKIDNGSKKK